MAVWLVRAGKHSEREALALERNIAATHGLQIESTWLCSRPTGGL
jgi:hypothetical protein